MAPAAKRVHIIAPEGVGSPLATEDGKVRAALPVPGFGMVLGFASFAVPPVGLLPLGETGLQALARTGAVSAPIFNRLRNSRLFTYLGVANSYQLSAA